MIFSIFLKSMDIIPLLFHCLAFDPYSFIIVFCFVLGLCQIEFIFNFILYIKMLISLLFFFCFKFDPLFFSFCFDFFCKIFDFSLTSPLNQLMLFPPIFFCLAFDSHYFIVLFSFFFFFFWGGGGL